MTIRPTDKITSIVINGEFQSYSYLGRTYKIPNAVEPVGFTPTKEETKRLFKLTRDYADEERPVEKTQEDRVRVIQNRMYSWSDRSRVGTGRAEPVNWLSEAGRRTVVQFLKDFDGEKD